MVTKVQEIKALDQIREIVEGLGENSYIGTAMAGVLEDAEENIKNDFALSMKDRWELAESRRKEAEEKLDELEKRAEHLQKRLDTEMSLGADALRRLRETEEVGGENLAKMIEYQGKCAEQENEIIRLKAKLYDLIVK